MLQASDFVAELQVQGCRSFTGVPCSCLTPLLNEIDARADSDYILASSEGDALSIASGLWLGGKMAAVLCQNSGLGNMVNPLTSLNHPFAIPVLLLVSWRGRPGEADEPQHELMGKITPDLLTLLGVEWSLLPGERAAALAMLRLACATLRSRQRPYALLLPCDTFMPQPGPRGDGVLAQWPQRHEILATLLAQLAPDAIIIATTGKTGRELFTLADRPGHFYCVGSMGYASSLAHGLALATWRPVYLLDGDGAAIMHLGNLTSIGASRPPNLTHILLDNHSYDSTGAQPSASGSTDFVAIARAAGYGSAEHCPSCADLARALNSPCAQGPRLLHVPISSGSLAALGRPTQAPAQVAHRLRRALSEPPTVSSVSSRI